MCAICIINLNSTVGLPERMTSARVKWHIHMCNKTYPYVWYDSLMCATWLINLNSNRGLPERLISARVEWLIHMCNMTYSYVWYDSFMCVTWLTNSNYNRKLPERITSARRDANRIRVDESCHTHERVMSHIQMSHTTRIDEGIPERMTSARRDANANAISPRTWKFELMSHVTRNDESCRTSEWVNSNSNWKEWHLLEVTPMPKRVRHEPESWHTWEWVMPHIWMSHITHANHDAMANAISPHTWVMTHMWMSHATHMNQSYHTHELWRQCQSDFAAHLSHGTHVNKTCHTHEWVMWTVTPVPMLFWEIVLFELLYKCERVMAHI